MSNIIGNSLRYVPEGGRVWITADETPDSVQIMINDNGSGIPEEDLPFIFDRFWRGDRSRSDRTHSGLGLAITRQLVHAHGGTIDVQSEGLPGKGTTFVIDLPM
jgi:two-component system sensor histidine kinase ResE